MTSDSLDIPDRWRELFRLIPGYDPIATRGDCTFNSDRADKAVRFFPSMLVHIEGKWADPPQPFALEPWQAAHIGCAFGWMRPDGTRRYREVFDYEPRKNGKTAKLGGLINLVAFGDQEPGAQIYSAAAEQEQAGLVFRQAKGMVLANPQLAKEARIYTTTKCIQYPGNAYYKALSAEAYTKHGLNAHLVVVDELHAQPNRELVDVLVTSTGSRRQPLTWYITTADFMRHSICNEKYEYACKVRDGIVNDPSFLPIIYEATPEDDWTDEKVWAKANPNLGVSVSLDYLRRECKRAQETPAYENTFRRLHLNQRTATDVKWLTDPLWMTPPNAEPFDLSMLLGKPCWGGLDFGWRDDYAAFVLVFKIEEVYYVLCWFWLPKEGRRKKWVPPTAEFIGAGLVTLTPGNDTDMQTIYKQIRECRAKYDLRGIAYDPNNARKQGQDLQAEGFSVIEFWQTQKNYNEPCRLLETLLKTGRLRHGGNKVLRWMASNAATDENGLGLIMPKKKRSTEKIDGICALTMALSQAMLAKETSGGGFETW